MTTNNHPANGPVSLDRLHQISEILSKAAVQSDGGNLCYAMADAVKVIAGAIAAFGAEPVPCPKCNDTGMADSGGVQPWGEPILIECDCRVDMLQANYRDLSQPVDPQVAEYEEMMNQAGNSPVTPDGWKLVPVTAFPSQWAAGQKAFNSAGINKVDAVYKAMVAAAPQQEVKNV